ncbi:MAG TPA: response regulator [Gammaproteobacteria bacterium]|nr:response regulator [Gammaproteobacteria bacterium]
MAQILVVDDSPTELHYLSTLLERHGYAVTTATDGEQAVSKARETDPKLILMDVVMPGMNGFQATRQLARDAQTAGIPVIMVTTKDQETDRVWGLRQGAKAYLTKPVEEGDLVEKIRAVMEG